MKWLPASLTWLTSTRDGPLLALLGLVLLTWALGQWWRRTSGPDR